MGLASAARATSGRRRISIRSDVTIGERAFLIVIYGVVISFALFCLIPFWLVVAAAFTPEQLLLQDGFRLVPRALTTYAFEYVLHGRQVGRSYGVSAFVTLVGTLMALTVTVPFAYVVSRKVWIARPLAFLSYFTMVVGSGLVGFYILVSNWLGLKDSRWALILPYLMNPFYVFVLLAYFRTVPHELVEAAIIDGANDLLIFWRVVCPISGAAIATVALFYGLQYWNDWWLALLFSDNPANHPLQYMLRALQSQVDASRYIGNVSSAYKVLVPTHGIRMATVCLTIGPIVVVYPFVQRYFVRGILLGALKG
ncbi:MAG: carbohydrate ABC transporter permease [Anaerolineae bacterium]